MEAADGEQVRQVTCRTGQGRKDRSVLPRQDDAADAAGTGIVDAIQSGGSGTMLQFFDAVPTCWEKQRIFTQPKAVLRPSSMPSDDVADALQVGYLAAVSPQPIEPAWAILNRTSVRSALSPAALANLSKCTQAGSISAYPSRHDALRDPSLGDAEECCSEAAEAACPR